MTRPKLCVIHEGIGEYNAISKVAMAGAEVALEAGWDVSCIAKQLDEKLATRVTWLKLHVPSRLFFYKWMTARHYIQKALGGRTFDIIHAHQPQVSDLSDIFQCHFLTHMLFERQCTDRSSELRGIVRNAQERAVLVAEDFRYRHWNPRTTMLFNSEGTRQDFSRLYGQPPQNEVLPCPMPRVNLASAEERRAAKRSYLGEDCKLPVVGFLGGSIQRKGIQRLIAASAAENQLQFLVGGSGSDNVSFAPSARCKKIGLVRDLDRFYAACDVLLVASIYEPLGLVAFEAAARGTPVIATPEVGALPYLMEHSVGARWQPGTPLLPVVRELASRSQQIIEGVGRMELALGPARYGRRLLDTYEAVLKQKAQREPELDLVAEGAR
jgi:glycosyltransferase involved in cell wall biosynthesis